jgi:type I restriction enzyme M protein
MFYNTSIPTCIIVLKKHREGRDVLFIDASNQFEKEKKQNVMNEEHIDHVLELFRNRQSVEKEAYLASYEDIQNNDFNLNIPRYVDTSEEEEQIDIKQLSKEMSETNTAIKSSTDELLKMFEELTFSDDETKEAFGSLKKVIEG